MNRADRRSSIGKPWWKAKTLRRTRDGGLEVIVSQQGHTNRAAKWELRLEALGRGGRPAGAHPSQRAGRGIAGYRPNR